MKTIKAGILILLLSSLSATAADLPSIKSAPLAAPKPIWTGLHVGLNAGGKFGNNNGWNSQTWNLWNNPNFPADSVDYTSQALLSGTTSISSVVGFIGGGQIGYDWGVSLKDMNFVAGVEVDLQGIAESTANNGHWLTAPYANSYTSAGSILSNQQVSDNLSYIGTVRGRFGYLAMPTLLIYATGGLAYGGVNFRFQNIQTFQDHLSLWNIVYGQSSHSNTQVGWTAGGGLEWMFLPNWSAKAEYLYYDLGPVGGTVINTSHGIGSVLSGLQSTTNFSGRVSGNIARLGVNYHINLGPEPVMAKF